MLDFFFNMGVLLFRSWHDLLQETLFPWRFPVEDGRDANDIIEEATKKKADRNVKLWQTAASTNDTSPAAISKLKRFGTPHVWFRPGGKKEIGANADGSAGGATIVLCPGSGEDRAAEWMAPQLAKDTDARVLVLPPLEAKWSFGAVVEAQDVHKVADTITWVRDKHSSFSETKLKADDIVLLNKTGEKATRIEVGDMCLAKFGPNFILCFLSSWGGQMPGLAAPAPHGRRLRGSASQLSVFQIHKA